MPNRFLAGHHPALNQYGVWVSVPGVDVATATQRDQFLLSPDFKNEQVVAAGQVSVPSQNSVGVVSLFPYAMDVIPHVSWQESVEWGAIYYPMRLDLGLADGGAGIVMPFSVTAVVTRDRITWYNGTAYTEIVNYMVYNREMYS